MRTPAEYLRDQCVGTAALPLETWQHVWDNLFVEEIWILLHDPWLDLFLKSNHPLAAKILRLVQECDA